MNGYKKDLTKILGHYGAHNQICKTTEELAEACSACMKYQTELTEENFEHLAEELADVQIMVDQLRMIVPNLAERIEAYKGFKVKRQILRVNKELIEREKA